MKKPNYKQAERDILAILATEPEPKKPTSKTEIKDVTKEHLGTSYQFSENDLTIIKKDSTIEKKDDYNE